MTWQQKTFYVFCVSLGAKILAHLFGRDTILIILLATIWFELMCLNAQVEAQNSQSRMQR